MAAPANSGAVETVNVVVRCRPLNEREVFDGRHRNVEIDVKIGQISIQSPREEGGETPKLFTFDSVFDWTSTQQDVYEQTAKPVVDSVIEGYNGTVFAYGQTGTGKTYTMDGGGEPDEWGIIPRSFEHVFSAIHASVNEQFLVRTSFLEIYNEQIRDLLSKNPKNSLELKEGKDSGVYVKGLNTFVVKTVAEITAVLEVRNIFSIVRMNWLYP